jgi:hypothetical protein
VDSGRKRMVALQGLGGTFSIPYFDATGNQVLYVRVWNLGRGGRASAGADVQNCLKHPSSPARSAGSACASDRNGSQECGTPPDGDRSGS